MKNILGKINILIFLFNYDSIKYSPDFWNHSFVENMQNYCVEKNNSEYLFSAFLKNQNFNRKKLYSY